jgi:hypothetical protein
MFVVSMASARVIGGGIVGEYHPSGKVLRVIQLLYATENLSMSDIIGFKAACGEKQKLRNASKAGSQIGQRPLSSGEVAFV